jgi:hypothetical protein
MLTWFQNILKLASEICLILIYSFILHCYLLYKKFEGKVTEAEMQFYFKFGFHINNVIYVFLGINMVKFFTILIISIIRFFKNR